MSQPSNPASHPKQSVRERVPSTAPLRSDYADDPEMAELVGLFVSELPARLEAIDSAWASRDALTLRRMAHQLRGAGSGYGFPTVSQAAGSVEAALTAHGVALPEAALAEVREKVEALLAVCRQAAAPGGR